MTDFNLEGGIDFNEGDARQEAQRLANIVTDALEGAFKNLSREVNQTLTRNLRRTASATSEEFEGLAGKVQQTAARFNTVGEESEELARDLVALKRSAEATKKALSATDLDENIAATLERELEKAVRFQDKFRQNSEAIARSGDLRKAYELEWRGISNVILRQTSLLNRQIEASSRRQGLELEQAAARDKGVQQQRFEELRALNSKYVVDTQTAGARQVAEIKSTAAATLQSDRRTARVRLEILRFTLRQARVIERSIGTLFRTSAAIVSGAFARIERTVFRIGGVFRRSNRDINDGLGGALLRRERTIDRSFDRQTSIIRSSTARQERIIQRFQTRASTGLAGAATGRSGLGTLLGGGLAVGGGFLVLDRLRAGFDEAVNLNEALNKTRQIFGDASGDIEAFTQTSVESLFVTQSAALEAAANFGIFGKAAGLVGPDLSNFSKDLTLLATDLASFNNTEISDATTAISAALRGESEPIRRYGVLLNEATLQTRALELGIIDTTRKLQPFERVLAANAEIFAQTADQRDDAARTADDFANSSRRAAAASVETAAAISRAFVPIAEFFTNFTFRTLPRLTAFIEGNVGPGLKVLRDGLIGAGAALAGLLAARGAVEVIGFLGTALRLVITPLGAFVVAVGAIGAAVNILRKRSASFDEAIRGLISAVRSAFGEVLSFAFRQIGRLADLIARTVIPVIVRLTEFISTNLRIGLEIISRLFSRLVIPAVQRFGRFIRDEVVPFVVQLADVVGGRVLDGLRQLRDLAVSLFETVQPFIQPAIDGFLALGDAILGLFIDRDISGLLDGVVDLAKGIGGTFVNIGEAAIDAIRPQLERIVGFIRGFFTRDRLFSIAEAFLVVVERIGEILGSIVTDPKFIGALAAIAAAAAIVAFRFVRGFARGVADNLDEWVDIVGPALRVAVEQAVSFALSNPALLGAALAAGLGSAAIVSAFRGFGNRGGEEAAGSFRSRFARSMRGRTQYLSGLLGGPAALDKAANRAARRTSRTFQRDFQRRLGNFRALGGEFEFVGTAASERDLQRLNKEFERLDSRLEGVNTRGALTRGVFRDIGQGIKDVVGGGADVVRGASFFQDFEDRGGERITRGFAKIRSAIGRGFANAREEFRQSGVTAGQAIGTGLIGGITAIVSGVVAGGALASGDTVGGIAGIGGIIAGALVASTVPVIGPALAGVTLAVGALSTALSFNKSQSEAAAREIREYADALAEAETVLERLAAVTKVLNDNLADENDSTILFLDEIGFRTAEFAEAILDGSNGTREALRSLSSAFGPLGDDFILFVNKITQGGGSIQDALRFIEFEGLFDAQGGERRFGITTAEVQALRTEFEKMGFSADVLTEALDFMFDEAAEGSTGVGDARARIAGLREETEAGASGARDLARFQNQFYSDLYNNLPAAESAAGRAWGVIQDLGTRAFNAVSGAVIGVGEDLGNLAVSGFDLAERAIDSLNEKRLQGVRDQIQNVTSDLGAARDAAGLALTNLTAFLTADYENTARQAIDNAVLGLDEIQGQLKEVSELGGTDTEQGRRRLNQVVEGFDKQVAAVLQAGVEDGTIVDQATAEAALAPIGVAAQELLSLGVEDGARGIDQRTFNLIADGITKALADDIFATNLEVLTDAQGEVERLQGELNDLNVELETRLVFDEDQIRRELQELFPDAPIELFTDQLLSGLQGEATGFATLDQIPVTQAEVDALVAAQEAARQAAAAQTQQFRDDQAGRAGTEVTNNWTVTITETSDARATGREFVLAASAAASAAGSLFGI